MASVNIEELRKTAQVVRLMQTIIAHASKQQKIWERNERISKIVAQLIEELMEKLPEAAGKGKTQVSLDVVVGDSDVDMGWEAARSFAKHCKKIGLCAEIHSHSRSDRYPQIIIYVVVGFSIQKEE